jgi:hypothetical protein
MMVVVIVQVPYPLPKLDLIAVPDFASGAMENWGCVTYRDTMLLIDPANSSALIKQRCAKTIAHEIAHVSLTSNASAQRISGLPIDTAPRRVLVV